MRIVSILILLTLAAAIYVANSASVDDAGSGTGAEQATQQVSALAPAGATDAAGTATTAGAEASLPTEFPSELTRRSGADAGAATAPAQPRSGSIGRGPKLKEPEGELDEATLALLEQRLNGATPSAPQSNAGSLAGSVAGAEFAPKPRRRPAREMPQPKLQGPGEVTDIVLPSQAPTARVTAPVADAADQSSAGTAPEGGSSEKAADGEALASAASSGAAEGAGAEEAGAAGSPASTDGRASSPANASITGRVADTEGAAVPGVRLTILDAVTREMVREIKADKTGAFAAAGVASGRYLVRVDPKSVPLGIASPVESDNCRTGAEPAGYGSPCVDVAGGTSDPLDIVLPLSSGIQGTVLSPAGSPQENALVRAVSRVKGFESHAVIAKTDGEGFYFMGLAPGPYELQVLLPGEGRPADISRRMLITAKPGSALLLDAVDFSKPDAPSARTATDDATSSDHAAAGPKKRTNTTIKSRRPGNARAASSRVGERAVTLASQPAQPTLAPREETASNERVELRGRVISKWGESLPALSVIAETLDGTIIEATQTSDAGRYIFEDIPVGSAIIRVASDLELNRMSPRGTTLLKRPAPVRVQTFEGQKRVSLEDVVVEVRRVYRLSGQIKIDPDAFKEFKKAVRPVQTGQDPLSEEHYRRAYYRGLRLTQRNKGSRDASAKGRPVHIESDGSFVWQCTLPADDILLVLEPRTARKKVGYRGAVGIPVTPAGVRPAKLEIAYPPRKGVEPKGPMMETLDALVGEPQG